MGYFGCYLAQGPRPKRPNNKAKVEEDNQLPPIALLRVMLLVGWLNFFHARLVSG